MREEEWRKKWEGKNGGRDEGRRMKGKMRGEGRKKGGREEDNFSFFQLLSPSVPPHQPLSANKYDALTTDRSCSIKSLSSFQGNLSTVRDFEIPSLSFQFEASKGIRSWFSPLERLRKEEGGKEGREVFFWGTGGSRGTHLVWINFILPFLSIDSSWREWRDWNDKLFRLGPFRSSLHLRDFKISSNFIEVLIHSLFDSLS